jgi:hypothetical protein
VLAYEDGIVDRPRPARVQRLCAVAAGFDPALARLETGQESARNQP